jgi:hypothetical protein
MKTPRDFNENYLHVPIRFETRSSERLVPCGGAGSQSGTTNLRSIGWESSSRGRIAGKINK